MAAIDKVHPSKYSYALLLPEGWIQTNGARDEVSINTVNQSMGNVATCEIKAPGGLRVSDLLLAEKPCGQTPGGSRSGLSLSFLGWNLNRF